LSLPWASECSPRPAASRRKCGPLIASRRAQIAAERTRLLAKLADRPVDAPPSEANVVWLSAAGMEGAELAHRLQRYGVYVKPGTAFGASDHVRFQIQDAPATERFLRALDGALGGR